MFVINKIRLEECQLRLYNSDKVRYLFISYKGEGAYSSVYKVQRLADGK